MGKTRETFSALQTGNEVKTQNGGPHFWVLNFLSWRNTCSYYDIGSGWLRWLPKQGGVHQAYSSHRVKKCALGFPFARHSFHSFCSSPHPRSLGALRKNADSPGMLIVLFLYITHLKRDGRKWPVAQNQLNSNVHLIWILISENKL
jgi:hypothetical protein